MNEVGAVSLKLKSCPGAQVITRNATINPPKISLGRYGYGYKPLSLAPGFR